jgi:hypothetical protein
MLKVLSQTKIEEERFEVERCQKEIKSRCGLLQQTLFLLQIRTEDETRNGLLDVNERKKFTTFEE